MAPVRPVSSRPVSDAGLLKRRDFYRLFLRPFPVWGEQVYGDWDNGFFYCIEQNQMVNVLMLMQPTSVSDRLAKAVRRGAIHRQKFVLNRPHHHGP